MTRAVFILFLVGGVGPMLASASRQQAPQSRKWITLPIPAPSSAAAAGVTECPFLEMGCPLGSTTATCDATAMNCVMAMQLLGAKCYWPAPTMGQACMQVTGVPVCACANA